ncbi:unnamed protein product [Coregonus sp. 'balchen']|nr:unnamed protein product [Coregonus sp. 'balchen']
MRNMPMMRATQSQRTSHTTITTVNHRQSQSTMNMDTERHRRHMNPTPSTTGTGPRERHRGERSHLPERLRALTENTPIDNTELTMTTPSDQRYYR